MEVYVLLMAFHGESLEFTVEDHLEQVFGTLEAAVKAAKSDEPSFMVEEVVKGEVWYVGEKDQEPFYSIVKKEIIQ